MKAMSLYLPHINYTVRVRDMKSLPKPHGSQTTVHACIIYEGKHGSTVYLPTKPAPPMVAHELTHVLFHICRERHMDFLSEEEHMAYIMQYLMGQILGYKWDNRVT